MKGRVARFKLSPFLFALFSISLFAQRDWQLCREP